MTYSIEGPDSGLVIAKINKLTADLAYVEELRKQDQRRWAAEIMARNLESDDELLRAAQDLGIAFSHPQ